VGDRVPARGGLVGGLGLGDNGDAALLVGENTDSLSLWYQSCNATSDRRGRHRVYLVVDEAGVL
jgi:hypothetical protein